MAVSIFRQRRSHLAHAFLLLLAIVKAWASTSEDKMPRWNSPALEQVMARLGEISLDGTWSKTFPLAAPPEVSVLGLKWHLHHKLALTAEGRPRSKWQIAALQSSLAPEGREYLRWNPPDSDTTVRFKMALIGRAFSHAGGKRWLIREKAEAKYEIRSPEGQAWVYVRGVLTEIEHPQLGRIIVETRGGLIRRMSQFEAAEAQMLMQASYDDMGCLTEIQFVHSEKHVFAWSTQGELILWRRPDGTEMRFTYDNCLLKSVTDGTKPALQLTWRENPGWRRGDRSWPAPWHLASYGECDYDYDFSPAGFLIEVRKHSGVEFSKTQFNPRRRRLEQQTAGESLFVLFAPRDTAPGGIEKVENGRGELLESYRYDNGGNLVSITRKGEPTLNISYDESGRLMALEEVKRQ